MDKVEKKLFYGFGIASFLWAFIAYFRTMAPTVSFWDCGEFIAVAKTLGVSHPPGAPLFVLLGRVACIIFFFVKEIAIRVNLLSTFTGALAVLFAYLILVDLINTIIKRDEGDGILVRLIPYVCAFAGSMLVAFSDTIWFNSVEAEVYGATAMEFTLVIWLILKWRHVRQTPWGDRIILLIVYISFLFAAIQLYSMAMIPALFVFVALVDEDKRKDWRFILMGLAMSTVVLSMWFPFWVGPICLAVTLIFLIFKLETAKWVNTLFSGFVISVLALQIPHYELSLYSIVEFNPEVAFEKVDGLMILILGAVIGFSWVLETNPAESKRRWSFAFWLVFLALLGYSVHLYIPIRAHLDPFVNENNPEVKFHGVFKKDKEGHFRWLDADWSQFRYFLERKQYGSEDMISRMFYRRASWQHQVLIHSHMGYGSYLYSQYVESFFGKPIDFLKWTDSLAAGLGFFILFHIPLIMGFLYFWERNRNGALLMLLVYLIGSFGMIFYMNFADGTKPELRDLEIWVARGSNGPQPEPVQMEVRDRDYFFTPAWVAYGMWMGIAMACFLDWLKTVAKTRNRRLNPLIAAVLLLALASPVLPYTQKYNSHDRHKNYVAWDYAYNLLMSCAKDAILFTNGDNDTFPLWALQEAEGVRRDVRIINLSLLNTDWYIEQLMDYDPIIDVYPLLDEYLLNPAARQNGKRLVSKEEFLQKVSHYPNFFREKTRVKLGKTGLTIDFPSYQEKSFIRVQDDMILNIITANNWKRPVYFAVTVSNSNFMGLWPYLKMEGFVYRLYPYAINQDERMIARDMEKLRYGLDSVFRFLDIGLADVNLESNTRELLTNYFAAFVGYANECSHNLKEAQDDMARLQKSADSLSPSRKPADAAREAVLKAGIAADQAKQEDLRKEIREKLERVISLLPQNVNGRLYAYQTFMMDNQPELAMQVLKNGLVLEPDRFEYNFPLGLVYFMTANELSGAEMQLKGEIQRLEREKATVAAAGIPALDDSLQKAGKQLDSVLQSREDKERMALPLLEKTVNEIDPDLKNPRNGRQTLMAVEYLFQLYSKMGSKEKALRLMERLSMAHPNDKRIQDRIEKLKKE